MTRFIKRHRSQLGRVSLVVVVVFGLVMTSGFAFLFIGSADAAALTNRSDTLDDSLHATTNVQHTFVFDVATTLVGVVGGGDDYQIRFAFPTGTVADPYIDVNLTPADVSISCSGAGCPGGAPTVTTVTEDSAGGQAENDRYTLSLDGANITGGTSTLTVTLGTGATGIGNPSDNPVANDGAGAACTDGADATEADVCSITIETSEEGAFTVVDNGDVLNAFISDVTVSVTVEEYLAFIITVPTEAACETPFGVLGSVYPTITSSSVAFGNISTPDTFFAGCQLLDVSTNAANGYNVIVSTDTSLEDGGTNVIDSGTCDGLPCTTTADDTWTTVTQSGFAYACDTQGGTAVCTGITEQTGYQIFACRGADAVCNPGVGVETPVAVMGDAAAVASDQAFFNYRLNISPTQAAAVYSAQVSWVATPTF